jgi:predicted N-acetyltransferase YhbS
MKPIQFAIMPETADDAAEVENLLDRCFGLARRTKTTYRLREGERPVAGLSLIARLPSGRLVGANSFWDLRIGEPVFRRCLLGPLAVAPDLQGIGIGRSLMRRGLAEARNLGHRLVILVGR